MSLSHPSYRPDIDGLRAIAVLLVVVHHAFPKLLPSGFIGVDLFFVISGFLITTIIFQNLERGSFSFLDFYTRRIKRIFPALALVLIACLVYGWFSLLPADYKLLGKHTVAGAAFVSNFAFWNESGYFNGDSKLKPLLHLWSLGIEEQYYIVWPLLAWLAWKKQVNLLKVCLTLLLLSLLANIVTVKYNAVAAFFSPATRFWELLVGSVLAYVALHRAASPQSDKHGLRNNQAAWVGGLLLLIGLVFIKPERRFPGFWALLPTLAAYLIIYAGPHAWLNRAVLSNKLLVWFGLISFPLYLWHWPLLVAADRSSVEPVSTELLITIIVISIVLAWTTYRLIERPIRFGKHKGNSTAIWLVLITLTTGYLGFNIYQRDGLSFRIPQSLQKIADFSNDYDVDSNFECLIHASSPNEQNPSHCYRNAANKKSILIWGDSYAWAMFAGINKIAANDANVYLMAKSSCPPILDLDAKKPSDCSQQNHRVFNAIQSEKYDQVIMVARWDHWNYQSDQYLTNIERTIDHLHHAGIKQIYIVGPPPEWHPGLQVVLIKNAMRDKLGHKLADRLTEGVTTSPLLDQQLLQLANKKKVQYISLLKILCNEEGCLTKVGDQPEDLMGYDDGHLSRKGGAFVAQQFPIEFFKSQP
ncbi:MAG TPA: acyltransferase family protein [Burkholderiaceae bacterium]|nr:acyltransferase family protein [Burkholderiaceae bacterium]